MKKNLVLLIILTLTVHYSHAQEQDKGEKTKGFDKSKLFIGGNFGLAFGDYTLINVSPQLGYRFNEYFAAGAGVNLQYVSLKQFYTNGDPYSRTSQGVAGLNIFGRVYPFRFMMLQVQPELNYIFGNEKFYGSPAQTISLDASIVPSLLVGGGAVFPQGNGAIIASVFYDALQRTNSPYSNRPFFNFGYNFGF